MPSIYIGYDDTEAAAYAVARLSIDRQMNLPIRIHGLMMERLQEAGLYTRPTEYRNGQLFDVISDAPMSTKFALTRFLVPHLAGSGWSLFIDSDMLIRCNLTDLFHRTATADFRDKAVFVVKHDHVPLNTNKMRGQAQTTYARKNWSSVMLFNCDHPANKRLTVEMVNTRRGLDLHQFCWLNDDEIGELGVEWNWLAGHSDPDVNPKIVHYTDGTPEKAAYRSAPYADEWWLEHKLWVG